MIAEQFSNILVRDLGKVKEELALYKNETDPWALQGDVKNSAGTLTLHLNGNLRHFIGTLLGNTGFVREREKEFSSRNISREKLSADLDETIAMVKKVLSSVNDTQVVQAYPADNFGKGTPTVFVLAQLVAHLNYHLGQVNYHRRMTMG